MKNGECTDPGIQSSENRTFVSAYAGQTTVTGSAARIVAVTKRAMVFTFHLLWHPAETCVSCVGQSASIHPDAGALQQLARLRPLFVRNQQTLREIASRGTGSVDAHFGDREILRIGGRIEDCTFCAWNKENVLLCAYARGDRPH